MIAFFVCSYLALEFGAVSNDVNAATYVESLHKYAEKGYMLLILSIPIFLVVYSDEVSSHSMQCIIGRGVTRSKILWAKLIDCFMKANDWSYEEAEEWIEYNVERALPYWGEGAPKIHNTLAIYPQNKKYASQKMERC